MADNSNKSLGTKPEEKKEDKKDEKKDQPIRALDEGDIHILRTYVCSEYFINCYAFKKFYLGLFYLPLRVFFCFFRAKVPMTQKLKQLKRILKTS